MIRLTIYQIFGFLSFSYRKGVDKTSTLLLLKESPMSSTTTKNPFVNFIKTQILQNARTFKDQTPNLDESVKTRHYKRTKDYDLSVYLEDPELVELASCNGKLVIFSERETEVIVENCILEAMVFLPKGRIVIKGLSLKMNSVVIAGEIQGEKGGYVETFTSMAFDGMRQDRFALPIVSTNLFIDKGLKTGIPLDFHAREWKTFGETEHPFSDLHRKRVYVNELTAMAFGLPINGGILDLIRESDDRTLNEFITAMTSVVEMSSAGQASAKRVVNVVREKVVEEDDSTGDDKEDKEDEGAPVDVPRRTTKRDRAERLNSRGKKKDHQSGGENDPLRDLPPSSPSENIEEGDKAESENKKGDDKKGGDKDKDKEGGGSTSIQ